MPSRLDGTVDSQHRDGEDADMPAAPLLANNVVRHYFSNGPTLSLCEYLGIVSGVVAICTKRGFSYSKLILLPFNIRCNPPSFFFIQKKKKKQIKKADFLLPFISRQLTDTDTLCYNNVVLKEYLYSRHDAKAPGVPSVKYIYSTGVYIPCIIVLYILCINRI